LNTSQKKQIIRLQLVIGLFTLALLSLAITISTVIASPQETQGITQNDAVAGLGIGAGLAIGLAGLGAGLGLGTASSAAIGAISERPEVFGRTIIFVAFIEGIGVFGFVIAFLLYLSIGA
jgi:V/A-type H+-transporting ATPase subunit K